MTTPILSARSNSTRAAEGSPHPTNTKEEKITQDLLDAQDVAEFKQTLARLFYEQLILPFKDTASPKMLVTAHAKINSAIYSALNGHMYNGTRDVYILLHLMHSRTDLFNTLQIIQLEVADENQVDSNQLPELMEQVYTVLKAEFERHHTMASKTSGHGQHENN